MKKVLNKIEKDVDETTNSHFSIDLILDHIKGGNKYFPKRKLKKLDKEELYLNREYFTFFRNDVKRETDYFKVIQAFNIKTVKKYFVKIFKKSILEKNRWLKKSQKLEIILMGSLKKSKSILKFEGVLEDQDEICIIYERQRELDFEKLKENGENLKYIKKLEAQIVVGLAEINSFGISVVNFTQKNVYFDNENQFVIGLFDGYFQHEEKINKKYLKILMDGDKDKAICEELLNTNTPNGKTDSWSIGIFILHCFTLYKNTKFFGKLDSEFDTEFQKSREYEEAERDLIISLTALKSIQRIFVQDVILHEYFSPFLIQMKFIEKIEALSPDKTPKKADFLNINLIQPDITEGRSLRGLVSPRHGNAQIHRHKINNDLFLKDDFTGRRKEKRKSNFAEMKREHFKRVGKAGSFGVNQKPSFNLEEIQKIEKKGREKIKKGRESREFRSVEKKSENSFPQFLKGIFGFFGCFDK